MKNKDNFSLKTAEITRLNHQGRGIAVINNKNTFISGALRGETVQYHLIKKRSSYNEGELIQVLPPVAQERTTPECEHTEICGGCSLQHMEMQAQIQLKQQTLLDQLRHFGKVCPENIIPPLSANSHGYRRKARLGVRYVIKKEKLLIGFREKNGRYLADLSACTVLHPAVGLKLREIAELICDLSIAREIPQVEVAIGDTEIALIFRTMVAVSPEDHIKLQNFGKCHEFQIYIQANSPALVEKIWPQDSVEYLKYTLPQYKLEYLFYPTDFTQINLELNRLMVDQAIAFLELSGQDTVLDLFCGLGNFTLPIALQAGHVIGIEGSTEMVKRAEKNALHNQVHNAEFYAADLMTKNTTKAPWLTRQYDKLLLDPPRAGAQDILPSLKHFLPRTIVYISCNPATLARDAGEIVNEHGYRLTHAGIMNMFPHTTHIEAMAVFKK